MEREFTCLGCAALVYEAAPIPRASDKCMTCAFLDTIPEPGRTVLRGTLQGGVQGMAAPTSADQVARDRARAATIVAEMQANIARAERIPQLRNIHAGLGRATTDVLMLTPFHSNIPDDVRKAVNDAAVALAFAKARVARHLDNLHGGGNPA